MVACRLRVSAGLNQMETVFAAPSSEGRGCRAAAGEGEEKNLCTPHPGPPSLDVPPSPFGRGIRPKAFSNCDTTDQQDCDGMIPV
jgi:hypothetical protein